MEKKDRVSDFFDWVGRQGMVLGLASIRRLLDGLGNPQTRLRVIHVAGTNGKGSLCCYLHEILSRSGYRVGMYTSPGVFSQRERFMVGGQWISEKAYEELILRIRKVCLKLREQGYRLPTRFEVETALAFLYFAQMRCDPVIIEAGMGGETDATNVIEEPLCSVITSVGEDHIPMLGNTVAEIAEVKAGIIKPHCPIVTVRQLPEVEEVLTRRAEAAGARLTFADPNCVHMVSRRPVRYRCRDGSDICLSMEGECQIANSVLAIETVDILRKRGLAIPQEALAEGLQRAKWPGRMECISRDPLCYLDGAHNLPAARQLRETLKNDFTNTGITYIIGVLADKDYVGMLRELAPLARCIVTVTPSNPRALSAGTLADAARGFCPYVTSALTTAQAAQAALDSGSEMILAFGSLSYLGEIKKELLSRIEGKNRV